MESFALDEDGFLLSEADGLWSNFPRLFPLSSVRRVDQVREAQICERRGATVMKAARNAGREAPINATVGSTCEGIQNVTPYLSNCGGMSLLIS